MEGNSTISSTSPAPGVLLLSCGTGEGHNSAASALGEALKAEGIPYEQKDPLSFGGSRAGERAASAYTLLIQRAPGAFNSLYKAGDKLSSPDRLSPVYYANARRAQRLADYLREKAFTQVICTHLFAMEAMTAVRREGLSTVPCYGVLTDYTCIPFTEETRLDGYFIPHRDLVGQIAAKGLPEARLLPFGIPVRERFSQPVSRESARAALGIPQDETMFLLMGGSAGCGHLEQVCQALLTRPGHWEAHVLLGHNREGLKGMERRFRQEKAIHPVGYTQRTDLYMAAADVVITKPGGLTSTETAVLGVPLVHLLAYSACEEANAAFFSQRGMSLRADTPEEAAAAAWRLSQDRSLQKSMREAQREFTNPRAARDIVKRVVLA